jgi:hypothetical protein
VEVLPTICSHLRDHRGIVPSALRCLTSLAPHMTVDVEETARVVDRARRGLSKQHGVSIALALEAEEALALQLVGSTSVSRVACAWDWG